jgi:hypothetical protein
MNHKSKSYLIAAVLCFALAAAWHPLGIFAFSGDPAKTATSAFFKVAGWGAPTSFAFAVLFLVLAIIAHGEKRLPPNIPK